MRDAKLDAAQRIGLDQVDKFPADQPGRQLVLNAADHAGGSQTLQEPARRSGQPDVYIGDAQLDGAIVDALFGHVHVVHAHDLAPAGVNDLLVEQILTHGQPRLVGMIVFEFLFFHGELDDARRHKRDLVVPRQQRQVFAAAKQIPRHAVRLVRRLDEQLGHPPDKVSLGVIGMAVQQFRSMQHGHSNLPGASCPPACRGQ